jgi:hypothetical protein
LCFQRGLRLKPAYERKAYVNKSEYRAPDGSESAFSQELIALIRSYYILLIAGPIIIALAAFAVLSCLPDKYTSIAYLRMDREEARSFMTMATSPAVADKALASYPDAGTSTESRIRYLTERVGLTDTEPLLADREVVRMFIFEVTSGDAREAQAINSHLIDAWLETVPFPQTQRTFLEGELSRNKVVADDTSVLLGRLQKDTSGPLSPPIANLTSSLIRRLDQSLALVNAIGKKLAGVTRDAVVAPPNLPQEPARVRKGVAILAGLLSIPVILAFLAFARLLSRGRSA